MALAYDSLQAVIQSKYLPKLYDNIFREDRYYTRKLIEKAKEFSGREIVVPLEYAKSANVEFTRKMDTYVLTTVDPFTAGTSEPRMLTGHLTIPIEEELMMNSAEAIDNILQAKIRNLQSSIEYTVGTNLFNRTTNGDTGANAHKWYNMEDIHSASSTFEGIAVADMASWAAGVIDASGASFSDDPSVEDNLLDPNSDVYIIKLLQQALALGKHKGGDKVIVCPQYIYDLVESILDPRKQGSKMSEKAGKFGFNLLDFRGVPIMPDDDMVAQQSGDTDGYIYVDNLDYMNMYFNKNAKFKAGKWLEPTNQNSKTMKVHTYGNLMCSNRSAQVVIQNLRSPKSYVNTNVY